MKTRIIWVGRTKNPGLASVCNDMADRIRRLAGFEVVELREPKVADDRKRIEAEGERILGSVDRSDYVIALDGGGREMNSPGLSKRIARHMAENPRDMVFVVGGPAGLSDEVRKRADLAWSLSKLTFSHDLARTILMEQIYRAFSIIHNLPYAR